MESDQAERRIARRIVLGYGTEIAHKERRYRGVIENISETGVNVLTGPVAGPFDITTGSVIELKFQTGEEETVQLQCRIVWVLNTPSHGMTYRMGMEIMNPPWEQIRHFL